MQCNFVYIYHYGRTATPIFDIVKMSYQISKPTATAYVIIFKVILLIDINPQFIREAGKANCTALRYIVCNYCCAPHVVLLVIIGL